MDHNWLTQTLGAFHSTKILVWISGISVCGMERYFPPGRTDLILFPLEHISHQELHEEMLKDRDEVAVLSAILSCFMWRSLTRIQNSTLPWYLWEKLTHFSYGWVCKPGKLRNDQSTIFQEIRCFCFRSRIGSNYGRSFCI